MGLEPDIGQQLTQVVHRPGGESAEDVPKVGRWVDAVVLAGAGREVKDGHRPATRRAAEGASSSAPTASVRLTPTPVRTDDRGMDRYYTNVGPKRGPILRRDRHGAHSHTRIDPGVPARTGPPK